MISPQYTSIHTQSTHYKEMSGGDHNFTMSFGHLAQEAHPAFHLGCEVLEGYLASCDNERRR